MSLVFHLYYHGKNGAAKKFMNEMKSSGTVDQIKQEPGSEQYQYFTPVDDSETLLLVDKWKNQSAIDAHHQSNMMNKIAKLRDKYDLHMHVESYASKASDNSKYIRK